MDKQLLSRHSGKLWNADYIKVIGCNFLLYFAFYLLTPLLPIYLDREFACDKDTMGIVLSGYVLATFLIRPLGGYLVDMFNRRRVMTCCFCAFFVLFFGYIAAGTLLMFAILRTLHGIPLGMASVSNSTAVIDVLPMSRRNEGVGFYGMGNNLAMAFAPFVGLYIYRETHDFQLLFWLATAVAFLGYLCSLSIKFRYQSEAIQSVGKGRLVWRHLFLYRGWLLAVNVVIFGLCWGVLSNYVTIYGEEELNIDTHAGVFFALLSLSSVVSRLTGRRAWRQGRLNYKCIQGIVLLVIGYVMFALSYNELTYYGAALFIGLGNGRMYPAFLNMFICVARDDQRGTANSSILISWDLGLFLGILSGGFLAEYFGFRGAFWFAAAVQVAGTLLFLCATRYFFNRRRLQ